MVSALRVPSVRTTSRAFSAFALLSAIVASLYLLFPTPLADVFFSGSVLLSVVFALVGSIGAWTDRTPLVWVAAFLLTGLAVLGMMSIGFFVAPAALFLLGSALFSQLAGPRRDRREAVVADPPTVPEAVRKTLTGIVFVAVGAGAVFGGAVRRELFGACASETLACAVEKTHWDAVGTTVLGLLVMCLGGWVVWRQMYVSWVLASTQTE